MTEVPSVLQKILAYKAIEVAAAESQRPLQELEQQAADMSPTRGFTKQLLQYTGEKKPAIIAEIKKASPSRGVIREDFDPTWLAQSYEQGGACCLSVLTDENFFQGQIDHLVTARAACTLPVLRKDFMIAPYQIYEARIIGADCILLIVAALDDQQLKTLADLAISLHMDVLIEVHNRQELERAMRLRLPLIGINNRNLHTFEASLNTTLELLTDVFYDRTVITESGIKSRADICELQRHGVHAFLIGETLMRATDPAHALKALLQDAPVQVETED